MYASRSLLPYVILIVLVCGSGPSFGSGALASDDQQVLIEGAARPHGFVKGGGRAVPLRRALALIVPAGYSINLPNAGAWADAPVSWRPARSFVQVLRTVLADNPLLTATVNTDLRLVTLREHAPSYDHPASAQTSGTAHMAVAAPFPDAPAAAPPVHTPFMHAAALVAVAASGGPAAAPVAESPPDSPGGLLGAAPRLTSPDFLKPASPARTPMMPMSASLTPPALAVPGATQITAQDTPELTIPVAVASPPVPRGWTIELADRTVKGVLGRWAHEEGWQFVWDVPTDFSIDASATIHGTFEDALDAVVEALKRSQVPIQTILYKGNKVLRVVPEGAG